MMSRETDWMIACTALTFAVLSAVRWTGSALNAPVHLPEAPEDRFLLVVNRWDCTEYAEVWKLWWQALEGLSASSKMVLIGDSGPLPDLPGIGPDDWLATESPAALNRVMTRSGVRQTPALVLLDGASRAVFAHQLPPISGSRERYSKAAKEFLSAWQKIMDARSTRPLPPENETSSS